MTLEDFLDRIDGPHQRAGAGYLVCCPGHEDQEPSLSVSEGEDGRILLKCHANGCSAGTIVSAMGLVLSDLFPGGGGGGGGEPEAIYQYRDAAGNVVYEILRMPGKKFRQRHYDPEHTDAKSDGYVYNLDGVTRVPYMLPELIEGVLGNRGIWGVEGEKDVHSMQAAGAVATNTKNWREDWNVYIQGAAISIVADRDEPGRALAKKVKDYVEPHAKLVRIVQAREGKDATDHLDAGLGLADFVPIRQGPKRGIVTSAELAERARLAIHSSPLDTPGYELLPGLPIKVRNGRMYALGGYQSDGKTHVAAQFTRSLAEQSTKIGYYTLEMPEADLRNIFLAHKGVPLKVMEEPWLLRQHPELLALFEVGVDEIEDWHLDIIFNTRVNADYISQTSADREHEIVIVDHIHRLGTGGERGKLESEVQKLTNLALEQNIPVLLLCQLRKTARGRDMVAYPKPSLQEFRETSVIADDAAMALSIWRQRDDSGMRYIPGVPPHLTILKNRYTTGPEDAAGREYFPTYDPITQLYTVTKGATYVQAESAGAAEPEPESDWGGIYD